MEKKFVCPYCKHESITVEWHGESAFHPFEEYHEMQHEYYKCEKCKSTWDELEFGELIKKISKRKEL